MSSSIGGYIPLEVFFHWMSSSIGDFLPLRKIWSVLANSKIFKFQYFQVIFQLRSSSYHAFKILVWSFEIEFKIWGRSNKWLLRYSTFNIWGGLPSKVFLHWRLYYIGSLLPLEVFFNWRSSIGEDLISGSRFWDIQISIF